MSINPNDPRLTAYALGELDDEERAALDADLEHSAEARHAIDDIRRTAEQLTAELVAEPNPELTADLRARVEAQATKPAPASNEPAAPIILKRRRFYPMSIAAVLMGAIGLGLLGSVFWPSLSRARKLSPELARRMASNEESERDRLLAEANAPTGSQSNKPAKEIETKARDSYGGYSRKGKGSRGAPASEVQQQQMLQLNELGYTEAAETIDLSTVGKTASGSRVTGFNPSSAAGSELAESMDIDDGGNPESADVASEEYEQLAYADDDDDGVAVILNSLNRDNLTEDDLGYVEAPSEAKADKGRSSGGRGGPPPGKGGRGGGRESRELDEMIKPLRPYEAERLHDLGYVDPSGPGSESYARLVENLFLAVTKRPLSTFSIDVDTGAYSNVRRFLNQGQLPPRDAVRIEELVNYFKYDYPQPEGHDPFAVDMEVADCPWRGEHRLLRVGIQGREVFAEDRPSANIVFLLDVSGSMQPENKLPLVKSGMKLLVKNLEPHDYVSIVTYASGVQLVLPSTSCEQPRTILNAIDQLQADGSTNGAGGIQMAYKEVEANFIEGGINRVILCTDGDFNVGVTDREELARMVAAKAKTGTFLSVFGFGMGNLKDSTLEHLADRGNGHYGYIDTIDEAYRMFVEQLTSTLVTIAKDVKLQIEFNPAQVVAYRLIGYENRLLRDQDFNNDKKDAGEIGAGHTVTALYELVPHGTAVAEPQVDGLKYQPVEEDDGEETDAIEAEEEIGSEFANELLTLKIRYKQPEGDTSELLEFPLVDEGWTYDEADDDFRFAAAVASFGMIIRDSRFRGEATLDDVLELAGEAVGEDELGYRTEFLDLVAKARKLK